MFSCYKPLKLRVLLFSWCILFNLSLVYSQKSRHVLNFNRNWQLYVLDSAATLKDTISFRVGTDFKSQFDEQYVGSDKNSSRYQQALEKEEALAGYHREYSNIKYKAWKSVVLPCPVRYEQATSPGPGSFQGICYYRKYFSIPSKLKHQHLSLSFEGAMQSASVWVNDRYITQHRGGYTPFTIALDNVLKEGQNEIVVRLDNRDDPFTPPGKPSIRNGFLYWSGIYRDVKLEAKNDVHISDPVSAGVVAGGGVFIRTENISKEQATVLIKTHIRNVSLKRYGDLALHHIIKSQTGKIIKVLDTVLHAIGGKSDLSVAVQIPLINPHLWTPDSPHLYKLISEVRVGKQIVDRQENRFGVRHLSFSRKEGFELNGEHVRIHGTNLHQDYPFIGNAVTKSSQLRTLLKIKAAGFNFVRLAHYPYAPSFYDLCDSLGLMVSDAIPGWQFYNRSPLFKERVYRDVREMIRRDRNHPSIIMWEVSLNESLPPVGFRRECVRLAKEEYPGDQMFTSGDIGNSEDGVWDLAYNGWKEPFGRPQDVQPNTASFVREYGDYEYGGSKSTSRVERSQGQENLLQAAWNLQWQHNLLRGPVYYPWTVGDANWAFYDGVEGGSKINSNWGIADIYHIPKFSYYFYQSQKDPLRCEPMLYIANWWNPYEGKKKVVVYSNCDSVALFLNGKFLKMQKPDNGPDSEYGDFLHGGNPFDGGNARNLAHPPFTFEGITFVAGTLKADGYIAGRKVLTREVRTPETAHSLKLSADLQGIPLNADGADVVFVHAAVIDRNGTVCTLDNKSVVSFTVSGKAESVSPVKVRVRAGIASILLKSDEIAGSIKITAMSNDGLSGTVVLKSKHAHSVKKSKGSYGRKGVR